MRIERLPSGQVAPDDVDCISVVPREDGRYDLWATALVACGDGDAMESVALVGLPPFDTQDEAEAVSLAWAADQCVETVYVGDVEFSISEKLDGQDEA